MRKSLAHNPANGRLSTRSIALTMRRLPMSVQTSGPLGFEEPRTRLDAVGLEGHDHDRSGRACRDAQRQQRHVPEDRRRPS